MTADLRVQFKEAWRRRSLLMFDNLGIFVNTDKLPSAEKLKAARRRLYGTHRLSRLWCKKIRPRLFPKKQILIEFDVWWLQEQQRLEFSNELMNQAKAAGYIE